MVCFKFDKMGCSGCAQSVTRAVFSVEPKAGVEVDLGVKLVTVSGARGQADQLVLAIAAAGFPTEQLSAAA